MSKLYGKQHRDLQDKFETRKLADKIEELIVHLQSTFFIPENFPMSRLIVNGPRHDEE
jgi:hypothetical protein